MYGLGAVVCSCMALDREEGQNWYLFSLRLSGTGYGEKDRQGQIFSEMLTLLPICSGLCKAILDRGALIPRFQMKQRVIYMIHDASFVIAVTDLDK